MLEEFSSNARGNSNKSLEENVVAGGSLLPWIRQHFNVELSLRRIGASSTYLARIA